MIEMETIEQGKADDSRGSGVAVQRFVRHLDLFSGIGGFALAAQMVGGIETVAFCEIEEYPQRVLTKNFPGVPIHQDVQTLNPTQYGRIDLITAGYPCQPFSYAGKRKGASDDRHLWPEVRRIIGGAKPRWVLCENVDGHVTMGLDDVLTDLDAIGYTGRPLVIPACAVSAPIISDRVWILAAPTSGSEQRSGTQCDERRLQNALLQEGGNRDHFSTEPRADRVADGLPSRVDRIRGLGNAIVPQVAAEILRCMMRVDSLANAKGDSQSPDQ